MNHRIIQEHIDRRPFVAFEIWIEGGFAVRVVSPDAAGMGMAMMEVILHDEDGRELIIDVDKVVALNSLAPPYR